MSAFRLIVSSSVHGGRFDSMKMKLLSTSRCPTGDTARNVEELLMTRERMRRSHSCSIVWAMGGISTCGDMASGRYRGTGAR